jgi:hypothetical protein
VCWPLTSVALFTYIFLYSLFLLYISFTAICICLSFLFPLFLPLLSGSLLTEISDLFSRQTAGIWFRQGHTLQLHYTSSPGGFSWALQYTLYSEGPRALHLELSSAIPCSLRVIMGFTSCILRVIMGFTSCILRVIRGFTSCILRVTRGFTSCILSVLKGFTPLFLGLSGALHLVF